MTGQKSPPFLQTFRLDQYQFDGMVQAYPDRFSFRVTLSWETKVSRSHFYHGNLADPVTNIFTACKSALAGLSDRTISDPNRVPTKLLASHHE